MNTRGKQRDSPSLMQAPSQKKSSIEESNSGQLSLEQEKLQDKHRDLEDKLKETDRQLGRAKADLADAEAGLGRAKANLADAEAGLGRAEAVFGRAEAGLGRAKANLADAKADLADAEAGLGRARADLVEAEQVVTIARRGVTIAHQSVHEAQQGVIEANQRVTQAIRNELEIARKRTHYFNEISQTKDRISDLATQLKDLRIERSTSVVEKVGLSDPPSKAAKDAESKARWKRFHPLQIPFSARACELLQKLKTCDNRTESFAVDLIGEHIGDHVTTDTAIAIDSAVWTRASNLCQEIKTTWNAQFCKRTADETTHSAIFCSYFQKFLFPTNENQTGMVLHQAQCGLWRGSNSKSDLSVYMMNTDRDQFPVLMGEVKCSPGDAAQWQSRMCSIDSTFYQLPENEFRVYIGIALTPESLVIELHLPLKPSSRKQSDWVWCLISNTDWKNNPVADLTMLYVMVHSLLRSQPIRPVQFPFRSLWNTEKPTDCKSFYKSQERYAFARVARVGNELFKLYTTSDVFKSDSGSETETLEHRVKSICDMMMKYGGVKDVRICYSIPHSAVVTRYDFIEAHTSATKVRHFTSMIQILAKLHSNGIVHGDIRDSNMLFDRQANRGHSGGIGGGGGSTRSTSHDDTDTDTGTDIGTDTGTWLIDFDLMGYHNKDCYPSGYANVDSVRHQDAKANQVMLTQHDLYSLSVIMDSYKTRDSNHQQAWSGLCSQVSGAVNAQDINLAFEKQFLEAEIVFNRN